MLRIPHCLDNRLRDAGEVVSLTHRPRSTPQKHFFLLLILISVRGCKPQGLVRSEGLGKSKTFIHHIGSRSRGLLTCSTVRQPRVPRTEHIKIWLQTLVRRRHPPVHRGVQNVLKTVLPNGSQRGARYRCRPQMYMQMITPRCVMIQILFYRFQAIRGFHCYRLPLSGRSPSGPPPVPVIRIRFSINIQSEHLLLNNVDKILSHVLSSITILSCLQQQSFSRSGTTHAAILRVKFMSVRKY
jgi:hypothetical protein